MISFAVGGLFALEQPKQINGRRSAGHRPPAEADMETTEQDRTLLALVDAVRALEARLSRIDERAQRAGA